MLQTHPFIDYAAFGMKEKVAFHGQIRLLATDKHSQLFLKDDSLAKRRMIIKYNYRNV